MTARSPEVASTASNLVRVAVRVAVIATVVGMALVASLFGAFGGRVMARAAMPDIEEMEEIIDPWVPATAEDVKAETSTGFGWHNMNLFVIERGPSASRSFSPADDDPSGAADDIIERIERAGWERVVHPEVRSNVTHHQGWLRARVSQNGPRDVLISIEHWAPTPLALLPSLTGALAAGGVLVPALWVRRLRRR